MAVALILQSLLGATGCVVALLLWKLRNMLLAPFRSSLLALPGPPSESWLLGNLNQIFKSEDEMACDEWVNKYGPTLMYREFFNVPRLYTVDTRALTHIMTHSAEYQKPEQARRTLASVLGEGVLFTEGEKHRQQRRVMNPAFGPAQIRELTDIFMSKSLELRDLWMSEIALHGGAVARLDVLKDLSKMTLDVIGLAGFNYDFNSLNPKGPPNELGEAFKEIFNIPDKIPMAFVLRNFFPVLKYIIRDARSRRSDEAQRTMRRIGKQLIAEKKAAIVRETAERKEKNPGDTGVARNDMQGRDLLTLLLKANMATDIPDNQRLSDEDVLAQVPTFLVAGHETSSTGTAWALYALTQAPEVQKKLREELLAVDAETPSMDELNALPYLDMVLREVLRLHPPVPASIRVATHEDSIPLNEPFTDRSGEVRDSIKIDAGSHVVIHILGLNRMKALWGEDAYEFRPERWENPPEAVSGIPGVWGHMLTFLGGPRACIGYRFSLVEMKALLFTLVRAFEFELAVPAHDIMKRSTIVQRPLLRSAPEQGSQMPILVKRYDRA